MVKPTKAMKSMLAKAPGKDPLPLQQAVELLKQFSGRKFDQTVEIHMNLGIDPAQADQIVRGSVVLPNGIGKVQRVIVFAKGDLAKVAEEAGADAVGAEELSKRIKEGWLDFDVAIATPDMMGVVGPLGRVLGPRGLMPSPRAGTVTQDVATAVREYKAGKVEFRVDNGSNLHCVVGKMSFDVVKLQENIESLLSYIRSLKPSASKGVYLRGVVVSATMLPSIVVAV